MSSSRVDRASSLAPPSMSQKRKRRRRASSVFSVDPQGHSIRQSSVRPADDALASAKAAAMKLLDHSYRHASTLNAEVLIGPVDLRTDDHELYPRPPKKIRFQDAPSGPAGLTSQNSFSLEALSEGSDKEGKSSNTKIQKALPSPSLLRQCIDRRHKTQVTSLPKSYDDKGQAFVVKRNEIFAENAILDAFQASLSEFRFYHQDRVSQARAVWAVLPMTESERRSASSLYYGTPPPTPPTTSKQARGRPKLTPFVPPPQTPSDTALIRASAPRQASPICSDLDMEDYLEMFGDLTSPIVAQPDDERTLASEEVSCRLTAESASVFTTNLNDAVHSEREEKEMSISSDTSHSPSLIPFVESKLSTSSSSTRTTPVPPTQTIAQALPAASLSGLPQSPANLLTNALNAQYWAGYYTALYHNSLGLALPTAPPAEGACASALPCPPASIDKTGWEAGKNDALKTSGNPP